MGSLPACSGIRLAVGNQVKAFAVAVAIFAVSTAWAAEPSPKPSPYAMPPMPVADAIKAVEAASAPQNGPPIRELNYKPGPRQFQAFGGPGPYFPARASDLGITGVAVLKCNVAEGGKLNTCSLLAEAPTGFGFGAAAMRMAFQGFMTAKPVVGAVDGEEGRVVVEFISPKRR